MHLYGLTIVLTSFTATFQLPSLFFGDKEEEESRIFGGRKALQGEFPWMVLLEILNPEDETLASNCGGFILSKSYVMTAAHCVVENATQEIYAKVEDIIGNIGHVDRQRTIEVEFSEMYIHPDYNEDHYADIAILKLKTPLMKFGKNVQRICIADKGKKYPNKQPVVQMGWGCVDNVTTEETRFLKTTDKGYTLDDASCKVGNVPYAEPGRICVSNAKGERVCQGDSGGPLCIISGNDKLAIGVTSYDYYTWCVAGCKYPSQFTDIGYFADWIKLTVPMNNFCWKS